MAMKPIYRSFRVNKERDISTSADSHEIRSKTI